MNGADLDRAVMTGSDFTKAMIRDSMWTGTDMRGANFHEASLHRSDLSMAVWDETTRSPRVRSSEHGVQGRKRIGRLAAHLFDGKV